MRHNKNFAYRRCRVRLFDDGKPLVLPIDQFPVSDKSFYKEDGFPATQVELLDRFSRDANFDEDEVKAIVSRIQDTNDKDDSGKYTREQKLALLRPAWCQTASEVRDYELRIADLMETDLFKTATQNDTTQVFEEPISEEPKVVESPVVTES